MTQSEYSIKKICEHKYWNGRAIQDKPPKARQYLNENRPWSECPKKQCVTATRLSDLMANIGESNLETLAVFDCYFKKYSLNGEPVADSASNPLNTRYQSPVSTEDVTSTDAALVSLSIDAEPSLYLSIAIDGFDSQQQIDAEIIPDFELDDDVDQDYFLAQQEIDYLDTAPDLQLNDDYENVDQHVSINNVNVAAYNVSTNPGFELMSSNFDSDNDNNDAAQNSVEQQQDRSVKENSSMCNMF